MNGLHALRLGSLSLRWRPRAALACLVLAGVGLALAAALLGTGSLALGPAEVFASLLGQGQDPTAQRIVQRVRLPRVLTACLVGAALGMAGAIFQSISRNPLGSPDVIGFTTGAASGAIVQIILFDAGPLATSLAALAAGLCTALAVVLLARRGATAGGYRLVLVGIGVGASLSGLNSLLLVTGNLDQAMYAQLWLAGSLNTRTWSHVVPAALGLLASVPLALYHGRRLEVLELGDASAAQLGVAVERVRLQMVLVAVGMTAIATAAAGPIAFIALAGPQLARRLTRSAGVPLLSGALMGAVLLLAADLLGQRLAYVANLPIGLMTGLLGGFYLLWLLLRSRRILAPASTTAQAAAAVDTDHLAGDERSALAEQELDQRGHFVRPPEPLHGDGRENPPFLLAADRAGLAEQLGLDRPGRHRVDRDAQRRQLQRPGASHPDQRALRRGVGGAFAGAVDRPAAQVDDAARRRTLEPRQAGLGKLHGDPHVEVEDLLQSGQVEVLQALRQGDPGVVDQGIHGAFREQSAQRLGGLRRIGQVAAQQTSRKVVARMAGDAHYTPAGGRQAPGQGQADATGGAGDQRGTMIRHDDSPV